jgi:hypothetical protein
MIEEEHSMPWRIFLVLVAIAGAYLAYTFLARARQPVKGPGIEAKAKETKQGEIDKIYGGSDLRILQFYSPSNGLIEGEQTTLCYGVINARSVRMEPPVDGVGVSLNRCVAISPQRETTYKLIAEGADGKTVSQSVTVSTRADTSTLPRVQSFKMEKVIFEGGRYLYTLAFQAENVAEIHLDPPVLPVLRGTPFGTFYVKPDKTTTYTLTVVDKKGRRASKQLTVKVPPEQK